MRSAWRYMSLFFFSRSFRSFGHISSRAGSRFMSRSASLTATAILLLRIARI